MNIKSVKPKNLDSKLTVSDIHPDRETTEKII